MPVGDGALCSSSTTSGRAIIVGVQKANHEIAPFSFSHFRSLKLPLRDAVHGVRTGRTRILHIGLITGEFLLRSVTILDESIVALANQRVDLLEGDSRSLRCQLLTEHLCNPGELGISREAAIRGRLITSLKADCVQG
jgi:hypothetical protein